MRNVIVETQVNTRTIKRPMFITCKSKIESIRILCYIGYGRSAMNTKANATFEAGGNHVQEIAETSTIDKHHAASISIISKLAASTILVPLSPKKR